MQVKSYERLSRVYDLDWGAFARECVTLICRMLSERGISKARILDLACGTGTLAVELAKLGHSVYGIDLSPQMIEIAKFKSSNWPEVTFDIQDMTQFHVESKFDLVTCTFDSINYILEINGLKMMFSRVAKALNESGAFIFDSNTAHLYANRRHWKDVRKLGKEAFIQKFDYDPQHQEGTTIFEFADGTVEVHQQRPYGLSELRPLLAEAGLHVVYSFSKLDESPYNSESERLICVVEKEAILH